MFFRLITFLISSGLALAGTSDDFNVRNIAWGMTLRGLDWGMTPSEVWHSETAVRHAKNDCFDPIKGNNLRHVPEQNALACLGRENEGANDTGIEFDFLNDRLIALRYNRLTDNLSVLGAYMGMWGGMFDYLGGPGVFQDKVHHGPAHNQAIGDSIREYQLNNVEVSMAFSLNYRTVGQVAAFYSKGAPHPHIVQITIARNNTP